MAVFKFLLFTTECFVWCSTTKFESGSKLGCVVYSWDCWVHYVLTRMCSSSLRVHGSSVLEFKYVLELHKCTSIIFFIFFCSANCDWGVLTYEIYWDATSIIWSNIYIYIYIYIYIMFNCHHDAIVLWCKMMSHDVLENALLCAGISDSRSRGNPVRLSDLGSAWVCNWQK